MLLVNWLKQNGGFAFFLFAFLVESVVVEFNLSVFLIGFVLFLISVPFYRCKTAVKRITSSIWRPFLLFEIVSNLVARILVFPFTLLSLSRYIRNSLYASNNNNICGTMIRTFLLTSLVVLFIPTTIITIKRVSC